MYRRILLATLAIMLLSLTGGCSGSPEAQFGEDSADVTRQDSQQGADDGSPEAAEGTSDQTEQDISNPAGIVVPEHLTEMSAELWEQYGDANCTQEERSSVCEYYIQTDLDSGKRSLKNLEWNTVCGWVQHYEGQSTWSTSSYDYETLGYEEGECYQAMYKE